MRFLPFSALAAAALLAAPAAVAQRMPTSPPPAVTTTGPVPPAMNAMAVRPLGPAPAFAPAMDLQMRAVLEQLGSYQAPPLHTLTPQQARETPSPAKAVMDLLHKAGMAPMAPMLDVSHRVVPSPAGGVLVRLYTPMSPASGPRPVIVYYHGGGWVIANLDTYEPGAMALAKKTDAIVVSVAYRQAPEAPYPAAHDDSFLAYRWALENAASFGGDPMRVATAGESAGGNLAVATALRARDEGVRLPAHVLSVYPIADGDTESLSYTRFAEAKPLSRAGMQWFFRYTLATPSDAAQPWISLVRANLRGLPPTTIVNAEVDPLESDGEELATALRAAGVSVERRMWTGVTHEFFGMDALLEQAAEAQNWSANRLRSAFGMAPMPAMQPAAPMPRRTVPARPRRGRNVRN